MEKGKVKLHPIAKEENAVIINKQEYNEASEDKKALYQPQWQEWKSGWVDCKGRDFEVFGHIRMVYRLKSSIDALADTDDPHPIAKEEKYKVESYTIGNQPKINEFGIPLSDTENPIPQNSLAGTLAMSILADTGKEQPIRMKCACPCHRDKNIKHFAACCDNGFITYTSPALNITTLDKMAADTGKGVGESYKLLQSVIDKCASLCSDPIEYLKIKSLTPKDFI